MGEDPRGPQHWKCSVRVLRVCLLHGECVYSVTALCNSGRVFRNCGLSAFQGTDPSLHLLLL